MSFSYSQTHGTCGHKAQLTRHSENQRYLKLSTIYMILLDIQFHSWLLYIQLWWVKPSSLKLTGSCYPIPPLSTYLWTGLLQSTPVRIHLTSLIGLKSARLMLTAHWYQDLDLSLLVKLNISSWPCLLNSKSRIMNTNTRLSTMDWFQELEMHDFIVQNFNILN